MHGISTQRSVEYPTGKLWYVLYSSWLDFIENKSLSGSSLRIFSRVAKALLWFSMVGMPDFLWLYPKTVSSGNRSFAAVESFPVEKDKPILSPFFLENSYP